MQSQNELFITLQEATKLCLYSQEYLSLRARQRKLRAVKMGRNWSTTKTWLQDYLKSADEYKEVLNEKKAENGFVTEARKQNANGIFQTTKTSKFFEPPDNLPIQEVHDAAPYVDLSGFQKSIRALRSVLQLRFALYLVIGFLFSGMIVGRDVLQRDYESLSVVIRELAGGFDVGVQVTIRGFSSIIQDSIGTFADRTFDTVVLLPERVDQFGNGFDQGYFLLMGRLNSFVQRVGEGFEYGVNSPRVALDVVSLGTRNLARGGKEFGNMFDRESRAFVSAMFAGVQGFGEGFDGGAKKIFNTSSLAVRALREGFDYGISMLDLDRESFHAYSASAVGYASIVAEGFMESSQDFARRVFDLIGATYGTLNNALEHALWQDIQTFAQKLQETKNVVGDAFAFLRQKGKENKGKELVTKKEIREEASKEEFIPQAAEKGFVVVPALGEDKEKLKEQVKASFSDEVKVQPHDEESGIITPVFRERKGEDYLYILVPLQVQRAK